MAASRLCSSSDVAVVNRSTLPAAAALPSCNIVAPPTENADREAGATRKVLRQMEIVSGAAASAAEIARRR